MAQESADSTPVGGERRGREKVREREKEKSISMRDLRECDLKSLQRCNLGR